MGFTNDKVSGAHDGDLDPSLAALQIGVYQVLIKKTQAFDLRKKLEDAFKAIPICRRLFMELYNLDSQLVIFSLISRIWKGLETAILLHLSARILVIIERGLKEGHIDPIAIVDALVVRLIAVVLVSLISWWTKRTEDVLEKQIKYHFELQIMDARLRTDIPLSQETDAKDKVSARRVYWAFEEITTFLGDLIEATSQIILIIHSTQSEAGILFVGACVAKPLFSTLTFRSLWNESWYSEINNEHFMRMRSLSTLCDEKYREDVLGGNMKEYILKEYTEANKRLGKTPNGDVWDVYDKRVSPNHDMLASILGDLPMIVCALRVMATPSTFSITSVAILFQSSSSLRQSLNSILRNTTDFNKNILYINETYELIDNAKNRAAAELAEKSPVMSSEGMGFELRNVSFSYPEGKTLTKALDKVSLTIEPGSLVIICGQNGSGKSTIMKLLSRLHDPTEGELLMNDLPLSSYKLTDIRSATALLSQDHKVYPISLCENIGLGHIDCVGDKDMIDAAAKKGGASECIANLVEGSETILDPPKDSTHYNVSHDKSDPLRRIMEKAWKKGDLSGGERQRIVASRTFMRFNSGRIRLCLVDEPTSALDAEAELNLFNELLKARDGKTMVFVTHRFGHLTRHADSIICMKEGKIEEIGKHEELMNREGEYCKLYNIQAEAFSDQSKL